MSENYGHVWPIILDENKYFFLDENKYFLHNFFSIKY